MEQEKKGKMGQSVKAMVFHGGKLLLLQKNDGRRRHHWEFPGGGLEQDEDFIAALRREVHEETGLAVAVLAPVGIWHYCCGGSCLNGVIFAAAAETAAVRLSHEHLQYAWVGPQELGGYRLHGSLCRSLRQMRAFAGAGGWRQVQPFLQAFGEVRYDGE